MVAAAPRAAMASWHLRVSKAPSAVTVAISCPGGIWSRSSGSMGASPISPVVNSAARISRVCSSIPIWILRQTLQLAPPCSGAPLALVLDLDAERTGRAAVGNVHLQRLPMARHLLKSGTVPSRPISREPGSRRSRLAMVSNQWRSHGSICLTAMPNSAFMVRQVWTAASLQAGWRPRRRWGRPPRSWRDRTRSSASHDASALRCKRPSSGSCRSEGAGLLMGTS